MIEVKDLSIRFGPKEVLKGLNFVLKEDLITVIIGRSGIGKSVLLKCILGLAIPQSGEIWIDGKEFLGATKSQKKEMVSHIGMLLQHGALFDSMNIFDNIAFALRYHRKHKEKEIQSLVKKYASVVGIDDALKMYPKDLSGGMKRKAALARAIVLEPKYLFYDEPTTGLDPTSAAIVDVTIRKLKEELGVTTLVVTHDLGMVDFLAQRVALLQEGKILYDMSKEEAFLANSPINELFLTKRERIHHENGFN